MNRPPPFRSHATLARSTLPEKHGKTPLSRVKAAIFDPRGIRLGAKVEGLSSASGGHPRDPKPKAPGS
jgi:hypothetical protein